MGARINRYVLGILLAQARNESLHAEAGQALSGRPRCFFECEHFTRAYFEHLKDRMAAGHFERWMQPWTLPQSRLVNPVAARVFGADILPEPPGQSKVGTNRVLAGEFFQRPSCLDKLVQRVRVGR